MRDVHMCTKYTGVLFNQNLHPLGLPALFVKTSSANLADAGTNVSTQIAHTHYRFSDLRPSNVTHMKAVHMKNATMVILPCDNCSMSYCTDCDNLHLNELGSDAMWDAGCGMYRSQLPV